MNTKDAYVLTKEIESIIKRECSSSDAKDLSAVSDQFI